MRLCVASAALLGLVAVICGGCALLDPEPRCPQTVAEAEALTYDDEVVAGGYVIRFIPSPDDPTYRGYDVNVTRPISERSRFNTYLLNVEARVPGITDGMPVLLIGERTDANARLVPGLCPGLTPVSEEEVRS
jgi:hypothetical protein